MKILPLQFLTLKTFLHGFYFPWLSHVVSLPFKILLKAHFLQKTWTQEKKKNSIHQNALIHFRGSFSTFSSIIQFFAPSLFTKILYNDGLRWDWISTLLNWFLFDFFLDTAECVREMLNLVKYEEQTQRILRSFKKKQVIKRVQN